MPNHDRIYQSEAERYDRLISREDVSNNLLKTMRKVSPELSDLHVADLGAGTGRLTTMLAPLVRSIVAIDSSESMLEVATAKLRGMGAENWLTKVGYHDEMPLADNSIDLLTAGWTICYSTSSNNSDWREQLERIMDEISRVLRPEGTVIIFENFGTGTEQPSPPDFLTSYYNALEQDFGFEHVAIRTDYQFESTEEAVELIRFFFGEAFSSGIEASGRTSFPEWTGVWWKRL
ncbi:class I SAM-dependent methyltransferase [Paenibacillus sp. OV219]|uniref:class I SAM-dependent methyltransferase n=1 Tax=Paenibacillus sp. OV219 TaxID=1884377 RepID=UPI0008CD7CED|nr:class I SAM-dependent methyltransferase [Paenibacillus sp. OV219]SEM76284.1 Ubiquinone/menaquinone biosynthesis C-methylase UbiE [Paenibacillus sp. OV219]